MLLALGLRLIQVGYSDLTFDESASIFIARKPLAEMLPYLLRAIHEHPPGYYVLLAGWIQLVGDSEVALRLLSVFIGTLSIPLMYRVGQAADPLAAGEALVTTLTWRALKPLSGDVQITLDLIAQGGNVWGQRIYQAGEGFMTATNWPVDQALIDRQAVPIELGATPGVYEIEVGVYKPQKFARLRVMTDDGRITENFVLLGKVRVK